MLSEMVGTLCFGWCFTQLGPARALSALVAFAAVGLPLELWLLDKVRFFASSASSSIMRQDVPIENNCPQGLAGSRLAVVLAAGVAACTARTVHQIRFVRQCRFLRRHRG